MSKQERKEAWAKAARVQKVPNSCGKKYFKTKKRAARAASSWRDLGVTRTKMNVYKCPHCDGWHLTKMEQNGG